jgi:hypothetical protein
MPFCILRIILAAATPWSKHTESFFLFKTLTFEDDTYFVFSFDTNIPHSKVDWSNIDDKYRDDFSKGRALEVILKAGEVLYLPSYWMHFIVSLGTSLQCNARSGISHENDEALAQCGFGKRSKGYQG